MLDRLPGEVTGSPSLHGLFQLRGRVACLDGGKGATDESPAEDGQRPCAHTSQVEGRCVLGDPFMVTPEPGKDSGLKVFVTFPGYPYLDIADAFDAQGAGVTAVPVILVSVLAFASFPAYVAGQFSVHEAREKRPGFFLYIFQYLRRNVPHFLD